MAKIQDRGVLRVATKFDAIGFGLSNPVSGAVEGFDIEIAKIIAAKLLGENNRDQIEYTEGVTANREPLIQQGKVDLAIATYSITEKRKEQIAFAGPYYMAYASVMVPDDSRINAIDDLSDYTVCAVQGGTSYNRLSERIPTADLMSFDTNTKCFEALSDGRVDAVGSDNTIMLTWMAERPGQYRLLDEPIGEDPYGIGVDRCDTEFRTFINQVLQDSYDNGDWTAAWNKTLGEIMKIDAPRPPQIDAYTVQGC